VDIIHRSPVKEAITREHIQTHDSDHKLEMARRELNRSRGGHSLSGQKATLSTSITSGTRQASGRKLLYTDESSYAGLIVDTVSKDNRAEELREKVSDLSDFNFFDA